MRSIIAMALLLIAGAAFAQDGELNATIGGKGATLGESKGKCTVPASLKDALDRLEQDYAKFAKRNDALPKQVMFRRPDVPPQQVGPEWKLMDEMVRNGGPDDWLVASGKPDGDIGKLLAAVRPYLDGSYCEFSDWKALGQTIEAYAKNIARRHKTVKSIFEAVETNYVVWGNRIRKTLKPQSVDHGLVAQIYEVLGVRKESSEGAARLTSITLLANTIWAYISDVHPGTAMGYASAGMQTWTVLSGSLRLGELLHLDYKLMPFYLETAETYAWTQPLVDNYYRLEDDAYGIVQLVTSHLPFRAE